MNQRMNWVWMVAAVGLTACVAGCHSKTQTPPPSDINSTSPCGEDEACDEGAVYEDDAETSQRGQIEASEPVEAPAEAAVSEPAVAPEVEQPSVVEQTAPAIMVEEPASLQPSGVSSEAVQPAEEKQAEVVQSGDTPS